MMINPIKNRRCEKIFMAEECARLLPSMLARCFALRPAMTLGCAA
jgi:hypothetical protein